MAIYEYHNPFKGIVSIPRAGSWEPRETRAPSCGFSQEDLWLADRERKKKPYLTPRSSPAKYRAPVAEPHESLSETPTNTGDD